MLTMFSYAFAGADLQSMNAAKYFENHLLLTVLEISH